MPKIGDAYVEVHADLGQFKREMQAAGRGVSREIDVKADTSSLKGFNAELSKTSKNIRTTSKDTDAAGNSISNFTKRVVTANQGLDLMGKGVGLVKFPALISGASYAAQAVNNLAAGASALTGALTPLAGLAAAAPALYGAMGQAAGVVAFSGVSDLAGAVGGLNEKMDKTATEYKQLSEEGQKFARVLNQQKGPLQDIQKAVQRPLFEGMTKGIQSASKNLPVLKEVLVATSEEMGRLAEEAGKFAGREGFGRDMEAVGKNNAQLLGRLGDAGLHFADALRHVMVEAQPLVDFLGKSVLKFSEFVEEEAKAGRESGKLRDFFKETKDLLKVLVPTFADLGEGIWNVVRAGKPLGDDILGVLRDSAEEFRKWTESASGKNAIVQWYNDARNPLEQTAKLIRDIGELFFDIGSGGGLGNMIKQLRKELLPVIADVLESGRGFGPVFIDFVTETTQALKPFLGASGPLTILVKTLTGALRVVNELVEAVPALGTALATFVGARGIAKLFGGAGLLGSLFGGTKGLSSTGKVAGGALAGGFLSGWKGLAVGATVLNIASSASEGDWEQTGWKAGGALAGGIIGAFGGPAGAAIGATIGSVIGDALGKAVQPSAWAEEALKDLRGALRVDDHVLGMEGLRAAFDEIEDAGTKVTLPFIQGLRQAGEVGVRQAARMIQALKGVGPIAARALASPRKLTETLADAGAGQLRRIIRGAEEAGQAITRSQVKAWVAADKISAEKGAQILRQLDNVDAKAKDMQQSRWVQEGLGFGQAMTKDRKITKTEIQNLEGTLKLVPKKYQDAAGAATIAWAKEERRKGNISKTELRQIIGTVTDSVGKITNKYQKGVDQQVSSSRQGWGSITSIVHDGYDYIKRQTDKAAKGLGGKPPKWAVDAPQISSHGGGGAAGPGLSTNQRGGEILPAMAIGGLAATVPGRGTGDRHVLSLDGVPQAMVESREGIFVGNRRMMAAASAMNDRFPRFQEGGLAFALGPYTVPPITYDADHAPPNSHVHISGQPDSWVVAIGRQLQQMGFAVGENPAFGGVGGGHGHYGETDHYHGGAIDVNSTAGVNETRAEVARIAEILGGAGVGAAMAEKIARLIVKGPDGALKEMAQGGMDMVRRWANKKLSKMSPTTEGLVGGNVSENAQLGHRMLVQKPGEYQKDADRMFWGPWGESQWPPYNQLIISESGWSTTATNPSSGAYGIPQSLPGSKMATAGSDWRRNAATQIAWGLDYIRDPAQGGYGSPSNVPLGGYRRGGLLKHAAGGAQLNVSGASTAGVSQPINIEDILFDPAALAAGAVKGHGGESPSTPLQDWFQMMFGTEPVRKMKDIVGGINLRPDRFTNMATGYGKALDADELATVAQALETEDPITGAISYPLVPGRGDADGSRVAIGGLGAGIGEGWMDMELAELITVRNRILAAIPLVETLTKFVKQRADSLVGGEGSFLSRAKKIYNAAKRAYEQLKRRIGQLETQIQRLEGIKNPSDEQKKRLEQHKAKLQQFKENLPTLKVWMDAANFRVGAVGDVSTAFTEKGTALAGLTTQLKTDGAEDGSWPSLEELQGRTGRAGTIFDVTLEISSALRAAGEAAAAAAAEATGAGPGELETLSASLLQQQLEEERRRRAIAEAQTPVFEQFFGRTFHTGGIVGGVGNQGITVQAGEGIFTEDQMAAMGGSNVTVVVEDGAVDPNKIRVVVNDELSSVAARATRVGGTKGQKAVYR